jgi:hypothetical protein
MSEVSFMAQNKDTLETLQSALAEHDLIYRNAVAMLEREGPIVHSLRNAIAALKGEKLDATPVFWKYPGVLLRTPISGGSVSSTGLPIQPLPNRKPEYASITIIEAIQRVLVQSVKDYVHADELVREIYESTSDNDIFYRIKRTVVSEAIRGIRKGLFVRGSEKNTFGRGLMNGNGHKEEKRPTL